MAVYRLSVDYTLGDQVVGPSGKVAFVPSVKLADATGTAFGTVGNPIFTSGGGGGAITVADGADVAEGATSATAYSDSTGAAAGTVVGLNKGQYVLTAAMSAKLPTSVGAKTGALSLSVVPNTDTPFKVAGPDADRATSTAVANQIAGYYLAGGAITGRTTGQVAYLMTDAFGNLRVNPSYLASSSVNRAATFGIAQANSQGAQSDVVLATANWLYNGATLDAGRKVNLYSRFASSAASGAPTSAKATAGDVMGFFGLNTQASVRYLHIYNKASAPTLGTDTPVMSFPIAASAAFSFTIPNGGAYFNAGIAYAFTTDIVTIPTTGAAAADITAFTMLMA